MSEDIYQTDLLRLAARARGAGRLANPDASVTLDNPLCGDRITLDVQLEGDHVKAVGHEVKACVLCQAAATLIGEHAPGAKIDSLKAVAAALTTLLREGGPPPAGPFATLGVFQPVARHKSRHPCVQLPFRALVEAVTQASRKG